MGSVNKCLLVGNLGRDAEVRYTKNGDAVATLNLATTETWTDKQSGEKREQTEWHRVVIWGKTAESLQEYLVKGKQLFVEGKLQTRKWQDKDGHDRYTTEVRADRVVLLGGPREARDDDGPRVRPAQRHRDEPEPVEAATAAAELSDDEIPF